MRTRHLLALLLASLSLCTHAAESSYYAFSELLKLPSVQKIVDPGITLYWGEEPTPKFAEVARHEVLTRSGISVGPFGGSAAHCVEGFESALKALVREARLRGYDAIINIRAARDRKPTDDPLGFHCKPGYRTTEVALWSAYAMTPAAVQRAAEAEQRLANLPPRPPAEGAIYLPLDAIVASPEAQAVLAPHVKGAHVGQPSPKYRERQGPEVYSEDVKLDKLTPEEACKQAVVKTLDDIARTAKARRFDTIIKIRSFHKSQFAPVPTDVECLLNKKEAKVTLQASLATTQESE